MSETHSNIENSVALHVESTEFDTVLLAIHVRASEVYTQLPVCTNFKLFMYYNQSFKKYLMAFNGKVIN
jgi:hypothetical protein